jgi:hypothetical protein
MLKWQHDGLRIFSFQPDSDVMLNYWESYKYRHYKFTILQITKIRNNNGISSNVNNKTGKV